MENPMEAKLYIDGNYWATILIPGDNPITTLAQGIANQANMERTLNNPKRYTTDDVDCSIMLRLKRTTLFNRKSDTSEHNSTPSEPATL